MPKYNAEPPDLRTQSGRLRWARERAGFTSARSAAKAKEWNEATYRAHEGGQRGAEGLKQRHLERYARGFKVNVAWLATGKGDPLKADVSDLSAEEAELIRLMRAAKGAA